MKKEEKHSPAGIKEIAKLLGISIGTVDRALHGRPGISPKTRARVLKKAEELNYRPNVAARNLKLNRRLRIAVRLPRQITSFFDPLREGIRATAAGSNGVAPWIWTFVRIPTSARGMSNCWNPISAANMTA
jgi:LacI family transcriptional regulator